MQIYKLTYDVGGERNKQTVIVNDTSRMSIEEALSRRDSSFDTSYSGCKITKTEYVSIDKISVGELSFGDFMRLFGKYQGKDLNYLS